MCLGDLPLVVPADWISGLMRRRCCSHLNPLQYTKTIPVNDCDVNVKTQIKLTKSMFSKQKYPPFCASQVRFSPQAKRTDNNVAVYMCAAGCGDGTAIRAAA